MDSMERPLHGIDSVVFSPDGDRTSELAFELPEQNASRIDQFEKNYIEDFDRKLFYLLSTRFKYSWFGLIGLSIGNILLFIITLTLVLSSSNKQGNPFQLILSQLILSLN